MLTDEEKLDLEFFRSLSEDELDELLDEDWIYIESLEKKESTPSPEDASLRTSQMIGAIPEPTNRKMFTWNVIAGPMTYEIEAPSKAEAEKKAGLQGIPFDRIEWNPSTALYGAGDQTRKTELARVGKTGPTGVAPYTTALLAQDYPIDVEPTNMQLFGSGLRDVASLPGRSIRTLVSDEGNLGTTKEDIQQKYPYAPLFSKATASQIVTDPITGVAIATAPAFGALTTGGKLSTGVMAGLGEGALASGFEALTTDADMDIIDILISGGIGGVLGGTTGAIKNKIKKILGNKYTDAIAERLIPKLRFTHKGTQEAMQEGIDESTKKLVRLFDEPSSLESMGVTEGTKSKIQTFPKSEMGGKNIFDYGARNPLEKVGGVPSMLPTPSGTANIPISGETILNTWKEQMLNGGMSIKQYTSKASKLSSMINDINEYMDISGKTTLNRDDIIRIAQEYSGDVPEAGEELIKQSGKTLIGTNAKQSFHSLFDPNAIQEIKAYRSFIDKPVSGVNVLDVIPLFGNKGVGSLGSDLYKLRASQGMSDAALKMQSPMFPFIVEDRQ